MSNLHTALALHQQGRLAEAVQLYQHLLRHTPNHPEVLHLLGVARHQQGHHQEAVDLIGRAITLQPGAAAFHCNLGEAHRALGNLDTAAECYQAALQLRPDYAEARNNLGVVAFARQRWQEAEEQFAEAVRLQPRDARFHGHLADARREQGKVQAAVAAYQEALRLNPHSAHAHCNLGPLLLLRGQPTEAVEHCRQATAIQPDLAEAFICLGRCLRDLGQFAEAMTAFEHALELAPRSAMLAANIGRAWQEMGDLAEALGWYERALRLEPTLLYARCTRADALREAGQVEGAISQYRQILREYPAYMEAHIGLGQALWDQGEAGGAVACYQHATQLRPEMAGIHADLGRVLASAGDLDGSVRSYRDALRRNPRCVPALGGLATTLRGQLPEEDFVRLEALLADPLLSAGRQATLHYGLAQVQDGQGHYERAAEHMVRANALQKAHWSERNKTYDPQAHTAFVDRLLEVFTSEFFLRVGSFGLASERPVFVVGMPRSGTTLTEQILASHPRVFGAGERTFASLGLSRLPGLMGHSGRPLPEQAVECCASITPEIVQQSAEWHLQQLAELDGDVAARIVDKLPDNYQLVGYLAALFPEARIIHCRRDLRDVALSCWLTNFAYLLWSVDLEHIAHRLEQYVRVTDHWRQVLPGRMLEIDYEQLVADAEGTSRRLIAWLGLEWHDDCLHFHQTERLVRTASVTQVRQPIYRRSVARWRRYESMLAPLLDHLHRRGLVG